MHALYLILVGFGAGFVQRVSGFGLGIFAMMFLPHFLPSHTAAATISTLFFCVTSSYNAIRYRKDVDYKTALPMIAASFVFIPLAVRASVLVSARIFEMLLGGVLILLSLYFLFFNQKIRVKAGTVNGAIAGAVGGILNGLFSTGGPPVVLYLSSAIHDNSVYFATIQFYFCFTNLYAIGTRAFNGVISGEILLCAAVGMVGCMMGDFVGKRIFARLSSEKLKKIIYLGMILSGILMLF